MTIPARPQLGTATYTSNWLLDVDISGDWIPVRGITNGSVPNVQVETDQLKLLGGSGWTFGVKRSRSWSGSLTLSRKRASATTYDPGQEFLRAAIDDSWGTVHLRWYKNDGVNLEAYEGVAVVDWAGQGGGPFEVDTVQVSLIGQGPRTPITHPAVG